MEKKTEREKICDFLKKLTFGKPNDVIRLAFEDEDTVRCILGKLDLTMLAGMKRSGTTVEIKLVDRLEAARRLAELLPEDMRDADKTQAQALINAIKDVEEKYGESVDD